MIAEPSPNPNLVSELVAVSRQAEITLLTPPPKPMTDRVLCNCYAYVQAVLGAIPRSQVLINNAGAAGNIAVFYYPTSGLHHFAVVVERKVDTVVITETNFKRCQKTTREISISDPNLLGFYTHK